MKEKRSLLKSIGIGLAVILTVVVYAYGVTVTKINFEETRSEKRKEVLTRILRALAHPNLVTYDYEETHLDYPFYLPCPESGEVAPPVQDTSDAYITVSVTCAGPKETVVVQGFNLQERSNGPINFITASGVELQLGRFSADDNGGFIEEVTLPDRLPVDETQIIRATGRIPVGAPHISEAALVTWEKIIETVFLALLATTAGTIFSIPISFMAARNLMSDVKSPLSSIATSLIGWPLGLFAGLQVTNLLISLLFGLNNLLIELGGLALCGAAAFLLVRRVLLSEDETQSLMAKLSKVLVTLLVIVLALLAVIFLGKALLIIGQSLVEPLGRFGFLGQATYIVGDIILMFIPIFAALAAGGFIGGMLGKFGQNVSDKREPSFAKVFNIVVAPISGATIAILIMLVINWFYQFENPAVITWWPGIIGALFGLALAILTTPQQSLPTGMVIYSISRTLLNATRSVEPLIMAIVFVAWAGLGPFAGALALGLHTVASLSKLYSEQVESIMSGPLEAIQATGANRLQTIIFAVVPQIIPPYISFTMYRWDINVRMSTIIGFVGGGGIGFILQQNINLLNYRAASVNMLAIAIVVATMDYISSSLRERFV